jgi:PAS domain S-box-containing protein
MLDTLEPIQTFSNLRRRAEQRWRQSKTKEEPPKLASEIMQLVQELQVHHIELELQNEELQESRTQVELALAHYADLYDSAITGYFTFDCKGIIIQTNLMGASFLGMERPKLLGKHFVSFIVKEDNLVFHGLLKKAFTTQQKQSCEVKLLKHGLSFMILHIEATSLNNGQEYRAVVQDITEQKEKEKLAHLHQQELTQVARVKSMGELASAIAHEINQPLSIILNYVNGCVRRLESNNYKIAEILDVMHLVVKQVELAGEIMHHMKDIMRQDERFYKPASINNIAQAAASQLQNEMHNNLSVLLELKLADNLPSVNVDHIQIELVILNLLRNSLEAVYKGNVAAPKIILRTERQNNMMIVSITNNGPHYSLEEEAHLFEPRFTTKSHNEGMGLSISRTIVEAHLGRLSSHKMSIFGVCFQFSLPIIVEEHES